MNCKSGGNISACGHATPDLSKSSSFYIVRMENQLLLIPSLTNEGTDTPLDGLLSVLRQPTKPGERHVKNIEWIVKVPATEEAKINNSVDRFQSSKLLTMQRKYRTLSTEWKIKEELQVLEQKAALRKDTLRDRKQSSSECVGGCPGLKPQSANFDNVYFHSQCKTDIDRTLFGRKGERLVYSTPAESSPRVPAVFSTSHSSVESHIKHLLIIDQSIPVHSYWDAAEKQSTGNPLSHHEDTAGNGTYKHAGCTGIFARRQLNQGPILLASHNLSSRKRKSADYPEHEIKRFDTWKDPMDTPPFTFLTSSLLSPKQTSSTSDLPPQLLFAANLPRHEVGPYKMSTAKNSVLEDQNCLSRTQHAADQVMRAVSLIE